jgi:uncharacterized membrane protein YphA (DoxX/SURF4 family)
MRKTAIWAARVILGGVFVAASVHKIADPESFAVSIFRYQLVPHAAINVLAILLPWVELLAGIALIAAPRLRTGAVILLAGMLAVFMLGIAQAMYRGIDISCGCFTSKPSSGHVSWLSLARNAALIALGFLAVRPSGARPASNAP